MEKGKKLVSASLVLRFFLWAIFVLFSNSDEIINGFLGDLIPRGFNGIHDVWRFFGSAIAVFVHMEIAYIIFTLHNALSKYNNWPPSSMRIKASLVFVVAVVVTYPGYKSGNEICARILFSIPFIDYFIMYKTHEQLKKQN